MHSMSPKRVRRDKVTHSVRDQEVQNKTRTYFSLILLSSLLLSPSCLRPRSCCFASCPRLGLEGRRGGGRKRGKKREKRIRDSPIRELIDC